MKRLLTAAFALAGLFAFGDGPATTLLQTKNTTLALQLANGVWNVVHYGVRVESADDAAALAWPGRWHGRTGDLPLRRPAAYAAFGGIKGGGFEPNKFGGLQVVHADGSLTVDLVADGDAAFVEDVPGATHLVLAQRDRVYPFRVVQHFRALEACDVIETWVELSNGEEGAVRLGRMDSFAMGFPQRSDRFWLQSATGAWAGEAHLYESEVARGQTVSIGSRCGVRNSWECNQSFMLTAGDRATETSGEVFGGVLCWSGTWAASVMRDHLDCLEVRAGADTSAGAYVLDAGKSVSLPKFAFTWSSSGKGQVSRNIHRWARDWQLPAGHKLRPVLLNSWEGSYFSFTEKTLTDMMDGTAEMGGELFVVDDGWFGTGKYARDDEHRDSVGLGDWVVNPEKLPRGLAWLAGEAGARGLGFGIWVEPEMVCTNSWLYEAHPEWVLQERRRPIGVGRGRSQTVLDLSNPAVRDNIFGQLDALYTSIPGLAYVKWDANAYFHDIGSTYLDGDHQANVPFDYTAGLYEILSKLRAKHPGVDMQACASGGGHVDYGFLRYADEVWASDDTDARERVFIQWGESQFYPACVLGSHVTAVPNHQTGRSTPLKYRFDVAMAGRLGFELHPKDMKPEEIAFAKRCVSDYKRLRPVVQLGDLYRLVSPYGHSHASLMYVSEDRSRAVLFLWGLERGVCERQQTIVLQGLDAGRRYRVKEINLMEGGRPHTKVDGLALGGGALMSMGVPMRLDGDYDSAVVELSAE